MHYITIFLPIHFPLVRFSFNRLEPHKIGGEVSEDVRCKGKTPASLFSTVEISCNQILNSRQTD